MFETIRARRGRPLFFDRHFSRLSRSAHFFELEIPGEEELEITVIALLKKNETDAARVRITVTANTLMIQSVPLSKPKEVASVVTVPFLRNEEGALAGHKSLSFSENLVAQRIAKERGADDAVFCNTRGNFCEGATSNLFVIFDDHGDEGTIQTPPLTSGCLPGTTREILIELGKKIGVNVVEKDIPAVVFG